MVLNMSNVMEFEKAKTSCLYKLSGFHHAFVKINFQSKLIYLDNGGLNPIPVRLSDCEKIQVMGLGELKYTNTECEWIKW